MERQCPECQSKAIKKNGFTRHGKQNHRCLDCGRQFSLKPTNDEYGELVGKGHQDEIYIKCRIID